MVETMSGWTDLTRGLTVSVGVVGGGSKTNVVPAEAWAEVDVRIARKADGPRIERKFAVLKAKDRRCSLTVTGGINRPPMEAHAVRCDSTDVHGCWLRIWGSSWKRQRLVELRTETSRLR